MGYMGFGMRKVDYTRRPKKAFKKIKKIYGEHVETVSKKRNRKERTSGETAESTYVPFYKTRIYKIAKWLSISAVCFMIAWYLVLQEKYHAYRQNQFEQKEFVEYYQSDMQSVSDLMTFVISRKNKLVTSKFNNEFDFNLTVKNIPQQNSYNGGEPKIRYATFQGAYYDEYPENHDMIAYGTLILERGDKAPVIYQNNWVYRLYEVSPSQIPRSLFKYLDTDQASFNKFLNNLKALNGNLVIDGDSIRINNVKVKDIGEYDFLYTSKPVFNTTKYKRGYAIKTLVGKLDDNLYWVREVVE